MIAVRLSIEIDDMPETIDAKGAARATFAIEEPIRLSKTFEYRTFTQINAIQDTSARDFSAWLAALAKEVSAGDFATGRIVIAGLANEVQAAEIDLVSRKGRYETITIRLPATDTIQLLRKLAMETLHYVLVEASRQFAPRKS